MSDESRGSIIAAKRKALGLSQDALATAVGTKQQTIEKIEADKIEHSRYFPEIARVLGLDIKLLVPGIDIPAQTLERVSHLRLIRAAFSINPQDLGMSEPEWAEAELTGALEAHHVLSLLDKTGLPLSFIRHGQSDDLSADDSRKLLTAALRTAYAPAGTPQRTAKRVQSRRG